MFLAKKETLSAVYRHLFDFQEVRKIEVF